MSLAAGSRLGVYEVSALLGTGGMGAVYRARDTKLGREVALKVVAESFIHDPERIARFRREAQVLAALNHPNIAAIYGFEEGAGEHALVLELVEGPTLADRIASAGSGGLPTDETLAIAQQIAAALDAAHEQGIVHRDLKPANIKVRDDGTVKVLDFGLAKALEGEAATVNVSNSPTLSVAATGMGVILGTAAYMAPEQAKGKRVDKRADIWGFGCVLFEMLSGRQPFGGETVSETLAEVMKSEPPWNALPDGLSPRVVTVLRRCLEKDPSRRVRDIGDVRLALEGGFDTTLLADGKSRATRQHATSWAVAVASLAVVAAAAAAGSYMLRPSTEMPLVRFTIDPPAGMAFQGSASAVASSTGSISPDGKRLVFPVRNASGAIQLWVRELDSLTARPLPGTDNARYQFWSADSQSVGFFADTRLYRVDLAGGRPRALAEAPAGRGGTWNADGVILFSNGPVFRIPASGGEAIAVTTPSPEEGEHSSPFFLPDQRHFLFFAARRGAGGSGSGFVHAGDLNTGSVKRLLEADTKAVYAPPGYLLFVRQGTLLAQPFDADDLALMGDPVPVADNVAWDTQLGGFSVSQAGALIYRMGPGPSAEENFRLAWVDDAGKQGESIGAPARYAGVNISPDGTRVAFHRHEGDGGDVWVLDLSGGTSSRLTFSPDQDNSSPIWSPDGARIAFASRRAGSWGLYTRRADGTGSEDLLMEATVPMAPMSWSPDSRSIVYGVVDPKTTGDFWLWSLPSRESHPLIQTSANEEHAQISPDGKWIAYQSDETGRSEVYVRPFPSLAGKWQISTAGGFYPRWRADSQELFFFDGARGTLWAVAVKPAADAAFGFGSARALFNTGYIFGTAHDGGSFRYALSADGRRFLLPQPSSATGQFGSSSPITVVLNWRAALQQ